MELQREQGFKFSDFLQLTTAQTFSLACLGIVTVKACGNIYSATESRLSYFPLCIFTISITKESCICSRVGREYFFTFAIAVLFPLFADLINHSSPSITESNVIPGPNPSINNEPKLHAAPL